MGVWHERIFLIGGSSPVLIQKKIDGTVLSSSVPFVCLVCVPFHCFVCVDSWKWFMCFVWVACLLLHVLCDVVVSRFCVDGDGLCMRWNSAD